MQGDLVRFTAVVVVDDVVVVAVTTPLPARSELHEVDFGMLPPFTSGFSLFAAALLLLVTLDFLTASKSALGDFFIFVFVGTEDTISDVV